MPSNWFQNWRPLFCGVLIRSESVNNAKPDHVMYLVFFPSCVAKMAVTFVFRKVLPVAYNKFTLYQIADFVKKRKKGRIKVEKFYRPLITCPFVMQWKGKKCALPETIKGNHGMYMSVSRPTFDKVHQFCLENPSTWSFFDERKVLHADISSAKLSIACE